MKTEQQIAEKAKEYCNELLDKSNNPSEWHSRFHGYIKGYEEANDEWQEKLRWKCTKLEPPVRREKSYKIEVKDAYVRDIIEINESKNIAGEIVTWINNEFTHWREIIE